MKNQSGFVVIALALAACHRTPAPAPAPTPMAATAPISDNGAAARAAAARRDSIARADAAARIETDRRSRAAAELSTIVASVNFDYDRDSLTAAAIATLDAKIPILKSRTTVRVRIEGNADDRGSDEYNLALGQRRAASVKRYLVARGIAEARLESVSYGEEHPLCHEDVESCWSRNRRDDFSVLTGTESLGDVRR